MKTDKLKEFCEDRIEFIQEIIDSCDDLIEKVHAYELINIKQMKEKFIGKKEAYQEVISLINKHDEK